MANPAPITDLAARSHIVAEMLDAIAETLWADAWASWNDENPEHRRAVDVSGRDIIDCMPLIPIEAFTGAAQLIKRLNELNGGELAELVAGVVERDGSEIGTLAHYLAMESLGHGVAYADDYPEHGIRVLDYLETHSPDGERFEISGVSR